MSPFELVFGVCRLLSFFPWRVSPSKFVFQGVCRFLSLFSWRLSPFAPVCSPVSPYTFGFHNLTGVAFRLVSVSSVAFEIVLLALTPFDLAFMACVALKLVLIVCVAFSEFLCNSVSLRVLFMACNLPS